MLLTVALVAIQITFLLRAMTRRNREPASRLAWIAVIGFVPVGGAIAYLLLGETNIGSRLVARQLQVRAGINEALTQLSIYDVTRSDRPSDAWTAPFQTGWSVNRFQPVQVSATEIFDDSDNCIDRIIEDIDAAARTVHVLFYIWLPDRNGRRVAEALQRAAGRGVTCRVLVDDLGSRSLIRSDIWRQMGEAGVRTTRALTIGIPFLRALTGRIDLRNHRKIVVVDTQAAYCGSQNCADPEFLPKARFGPWVDVMLRLEGTIVRQLQQIFIIDWLTYGNNDDVADAVGETEPPSTAAARAQVIATGPTVRHGAMADTFLSVIHSARRRLIITTPYYIPDSAIQNAISAAARRGVETTLILPKRNDSRFVAAASKSYYQDLLSAGVTLLEYEGGLLHAKTITVDGEVALVGSANIDRRSLELNYENNLLIEDAGLTGEIMALQERYAASAIAVDLDTVVAWPWHRRLICNAAAMMSPIL